jgi:hypothetical protein
MQSLRATGDANWRAFVHPDVQPLPQGHLLSYPNSVAADGTVGPLPDCEEFPDLVRLLLLLAMVMKWCCGLNITAHACASGVLCCTFWCNCT